MRSNMILTCLSLVIVTFITLNEIQAANFDCRKAKTDVEKLFCSNKALSNYDPDGELSKKLFYLDELLTEVYKDALQAYPDKKALRLGQEEWIEKYKARCNNITCLIMSYQYRITFIRENYPTFVYAGYNFIGEYEKMNPDWKEVKEHGKIIAQSISDNKMKFQISLKYPSNKTDSFIECNIGEAEAAYATFLDESRTVNFSDDGNCVFVLQFDKGRIAVTHYFGCKSYCGLDEKKMSELLSGVYLKKDPEQKLFK